MKPDLDELIGALEAELSAAPEGPGPREKYGLELARLGRRFISGSLPAAACGILAPFDLLTAMGVASCFIELLGGLLASAGAAGPMLDQAERAGFQADTCGYHRAVIGASLEGLTPVPDFLVATSSPCIGGLAALENMARIFKKELFVLNVPHEDAPHGVRFLAEQIKALAGFVTRHTGRPLDQDRLGETVIYSNRARSLTAEIYRLARRVPSPIDSYELRDFGLVTPLFSGTEAGVDVARSFRDELAARVEKGTSGVPGERLRLMWLQNRIHFDHPLIDILEKEYQAVIVVDEWNHVFWEPIDPDDPFTGLARRALAVPFLGGVKRRIGHLKKLARDYHVHGAINPCHWGCRQGTGARGLIADGLKEIGVPVLNLEVDCVDQRNFAPGQLKTRLEAFAEMLANRPSPWE